MYHDIIKKCMLFSELSKEDFTYALQFFSATEKIHEKGDFLNRVTAPLENFGLVLSGTIQVYMDDIDHLDIEKIGPAFENHVAFPDRVNTEFVEVIDEHTVKMRVWERGSGETLACGTGACAVAVASVLNGHVDGDSPVTVKLLGGDLQIFWNRQENLVYMTGPAATVFDGEIDVSFLK